MSTPGLIALLENPSPRCLAKVDNDDESLRYENNHNFQVYGHQKFKTGGILSCAAPLLPAPPPARRGVFVTVAFDWRPSELVIDLGWPTQLTQQNT